MPSMLAHCLCGDAAINRTGNDYMMDIIRRNSGAFHYGCQGPDLLMFYHVISFSGNKHIKTIQNYGCLMHDEKINEWIDALCREVKKNNKEEQIAYLAGFLCHHALDSNAHPMVYYRTGSKDKDVGYAHQLFESQIERGVLDMFKLDVRDYRPYKLLKAKSAVYDSLAELLAPCIKEVYGWDEPVKVYRDCFDDMMGIEKLIYNPTGARYKFIDFAERLVGWNGLGTSMVIPVEYDNKLDAMNYRRGKWLHATTGEASYEDFEMLFKRAIDESILKFNALEAYLHDRTDVKPILDLVGKRTYDTGVESAALEYFEKDGAV